MTSQIQETDGTKTLAPPQKLKSVVDADIAPTGSGKMISGSKGTRVSNSNSVAGNTRGSSLVISNG